MRRVAGLSSFALAVAGVAFLPGLGGPALASTTGSGSIVSSKAVAASGCNYVTYGWRVQLPDGVDNDEYDSRNVRSWDLDINVSDPYGAQYDWEFSYGTGTSGYGGSQGISGTEDFLFCSWSDAPGRYRITGKLTYTDLQYNDHSFQLTPGYVDVRRANTITTAKTNKARYRVGQRVKIKASVRDERVIGYGPAKYTTVLLQGWVKGRWKTVLTESTNSAGKVTFIGTASRSKRKYRVLTPAFGTANSSASRTFPVRTR